MSWSKNVLLIVIDTHKLHSLICVNAKLPRNLTF